MCLTEFIVPFKKVLANRYKYTVAKYNKLCYKGYARYKKKENKMRNKITSTFVADGYERQTLKILSQCFGGNISAAIRYAIMNIAPPTDEQVEQYLISENPTWSDAVESMIELRKNGFSFAQIANVLDSNGCTTKHGKKIKAFTVLRALRSKNEQ